MNFIHFIDLLFFVILPVGFIAYAIKYALEDINADDWNEIIIDENTKGAYFCEGCYEWRVRAGHELHLDSCDCPY